MKRFIVGVLVAAAAAVTVLMSPQGAANAAPTGCKKSMGYTYTMEGAQAYCSGGTGWYQAYVSCVFKVGGVHKFKEGSWKRAKSGQVSQVLCPLGYKVKFYGIGLKN